MAGTLTPTCATQTRASCGYERNGTRPVELEVPAVADGVPVIWLDHTEIYRPRQLGEA